MVDVKSFDLNLLVAFDALVRERSVTAAAGSVGIGQPAMSHALKRLRLLLGDPLLVRSGGVMRPTARALDLAVAIDQILSDISQRVLAAPSFVPAREARAFRLGAPDYVMVTVLPRLLPILADAAPSVRLVVQPVTRDDLAARLGDGSIDLAVGFYPDAGGALRHEMLFHEEHVCLFDADACGCAAPISLTTYVALRHFLVSLRGDLTGVVDTHLASLGQQRFVQLSTSSFLAIPFLLKGAHAAAVVPSRLAAHCHESIGLTVSPLPVVVPGFDVSLVWHSRSDSDLAHGWLREQIRAAAAPL